MNPLLATLGGKLTERWLNLLVLPGALFLAVTAVGTTLGHRHWHDVDRLRATLDDLAALWPRLWLILSEPAGRQIQSARDSFGAAARLAAWAVGYALLACWWWPAALVAVGCATAARARARTALGALAGLIEAAVDVHGRELATRIGLIAPEASGLLNHDTGDGMSEVFRKAG